MINLSTLNNYILFTEDNGDASAIGKLLLTYKIEDNDVTFFILKEGNKKLYTVPYYSVAIDNLLIDGIAYTKEELPLALSNIFLPPSGSESGEVTPADIAYLQQQINTNKVNVNKAYVIATYTDNILKLVTLGGLVTELNIPHFDSTKYYLKTEIDNIVTGIHDELNLKAYLEDVYTKDEVDAMIDALDISPEDIQQIETDIEDLKAGTISSVVYTALDGKLIVKDFNGDIVGTYTIPYFDTTKYYTKVQTDSQISTAVGNLNTTIQTKFGNYYTKDETYNRTEIDSKFAAIPVFDSTFFYTKAATDALLLTKANVADVYSKTQIDTKLLEYAKASSVYTKDETYNRTEIDGKLATKALQSTTYTKTEVDGLLVAKANVADVYNKTQIDTKILNLENQINDIDVSNFYTKPEVDAKLILKANAADVYTKIQTDTLLSAKANIADVYTKSQTFSQTEINNLLATKAPQSTTYTKTEVDTKLNLKANAADVYKKTETYSRTEVDTKVLNLESSISTIDTNLSTNYFTKTESDTRFVQKNNYTTIAVTGASATCNFATYNYYHLNLSGNDATLTLAATNLPEFGKPYYVTIKNNKTIDLEILGLTTIVPEAPKLLAGGIAEVSVMKWFDGTIKSTYIVSQ